MIPSSVSGRKFSLPPLLDLSKGIILIQGLSLTEVNVGIICSCLLTFPAFLERHGPRSFGSFLNMLLSYSPFRRWERSPGASSNRKFINSATWSPGNRSDEIVPDGSGYAKLNNDGHAIRVQDITRNRTADRQSQISSKAGDTNQDVEAWPGNDGILMDFQPTYPVAVHIPRRDAYERESKVQG